MTSPPAPVRAFRFEALLVGDAWLPDVRVEIDGAGRIASLDPRNPDTACEQVPGWTVPGVPNVHSHAFQRALAGLAEAGGPDSFWGWREVMYRLAAQPGPEEVEAIALQLYVELLKSDIKIVKVWSVGTELFIFISPLKQATDQKTKYS